jgi:hypothetical protein
MVEDDAAAGLEVRDAVFCYHRSQRDTSSQFVSNDQKPSQRTHVSITPSSTFPSVAVL